MEDNEEEIISHKLGVVARSKKETYDVFTTQEMYYFPQIESTGDDFIADVLTRAKKVQFHYYSFTCRQIQKM